MAIGIAVAVLWGFGPSYFLRAFLPLDGLDLLSHVHGFLYSSWIALFIAQTMLVANHRTDLHRQLGITAIVLAAALVVVGIAVDLDSIPEAQRAAWAALDAGPFAAFVRLGTRSSNLVMVFAALFVAAVVLRRHPATHKRLMLLACIVILVPALGRIASEIGWPIALTERGLLRARDGFWVQKVAPLIIPAGFLNLVALPFFFALVVYDFIKLHRIHFATLFGGIAIFLFLPFCKLIFEVMGY